MAGKEEEENEEDYADFFIEHNQHVKGGPALAAALAAVEEDSDEVQEDITASICARLEKMRLSKPTIFGKSLGITLHFWSGPDPELAFQFATDLQTATTTLLAPYYRGTSVRPLRVSWDIAQTEDESGVPDTWLQDEGRIAVILVVGGIDGVIIGFHSERFSFRGGDYSADSEADPSIMHVGSKRIPWRSVLESKRLRTDDGSSTDSADTDAPNSDIMRIVPDAGHSVWSNRTHLADTTCYFERNDTSGAVTRARVSVSIHTARIREQLNAMLASPEEFA